MGGLTLASSLGVGFVCGLALACASIVIYSLRTGISPMPSTPRARARILTAFPEDTAGPIYELGSGWGNLAFALADRFPNAEVLAYERSPVPYLVSRLRQRLFPRQNLSFQREDFFTVSLEQASVIVCYLCPPLMQRLARKLEQEAKPGTLVLSNTFSIPDWSAVAVHPLHDFYDNRVYVYHTGVAHPQGLEP